MVSVFSDEKRLIKRLILIAKNNAHIFYALALVMTYYNMVGLAYRKISKHPENKKSDSLLLSSVMRYLEDHRNIVQHVDYKAGTFFNEDLAGTLKDLKIWQESRPTPKNVFEKGSSKVIKKRSAKTHKDRLEIWKIIYDNNGRLKNPTIEITERSSGEKIIRKIYDAPRFRDVIQERDSSYSGEKIPVWYVLNYGSHVGSKDGYPSYSGLFFLQKARDENLPQNMEIAQRLLVEFVSEHFDFKPGKDSMDALEWLSKKISGGEQSKYIKILRYLV